MVLISEVGSPEKVPVPLDDDGSLPLKRLSRYFPAAVGLFFEWKEAKIPVKFGKSDMCLLPPDGGWDDKEFYVVRPSSRPATPAEQGHSAPKKRRAEPEVDTHVDGDLVEKISSFAWYYTKEDNMKRSAIPVTKNMAITYRHGDNQKLKDGDVVRLQSYYKAAVIVARVVHINDGHDFVLLKSEADDICDKDLIFQSVPPIKGMEYLLMGYSGTTHISFTNGIIASERTPRLRYLGSSGSFKGDSGGSCWTKDGRLIGMQVEIETVPHTVSNGRPASYATGGRCGIVPIDLIAGFIQPFMPPDEDFDFDE